MLIHDGSSGGPRARAARARTREHAKNTQDEKEEEFLDAKKNAHQTFSEETFTFFTTRGDEEEDEEDEEDATPGTTSKRKRENAFGGRGEGRRRRHFFRRIRRFWSDGLQTR